MNIGILSKIASGYLRIEVEGYYIEKFINMCTEQKILIWNLKREKGIKLYLNIGINDFKRLSPICRKTKCKVKIKRKKGIPFILHRYKGRKIFAIVLVIISIAIIISSQYIWNIDINIEDNQQIENLAQDLRELGIKRGIRKTEIDTNKIITELRLKRNDISWIGIDIKGTNVIISAVKADEKPEIIDNKDYCNIVASKGGIISSIVAQNGTALVKEGDTVQKGDILIAGYIEGKYTGKRLLHSLRRGASKNKI